MNLSPSDFGEPPRLRVLLDHHLLTEDAREPHRIASPLAELLLMSVCGMTVDFDDYAGSNAPRKPQQTRAPRRPERTPTLARAAPCGFAWRPCPDLRPSLPSYFRSPRPDQTRAGRPAANHRSVSAWLSPARVLRILCSWISLRLRRLLGRRRAPVRRCVLVFVNLNALAVQAFARPPLRLVAIAEDVIFPNFIVVEFDCRAGAAFLSCRHDRFLPLAPIGGENLSTPRCGKRSKDRHGDKLTILMRQLRWPHSVGTDA